MEESATDRCHCVRSVQHSATHRPILVNFTSYQHKRNVIPARRKLKATGTVINSFSWGGGRFSLYRNVKRHGKR